MLHAVPVVSAKFMSANEVTDEELGAFGMTDKLNALDKLIEAVEAGEATRTEVEHSAALALGLSNTSMDVAAAYSINDLNAALALHEALLPGCGWKTQKLLCNDYYTAEVWGEYAYSEESGSAPTPARAWLLAILRAYRSMQS